MTHKSKKIKSETSQAFLILISFLFFMLVFMVVGLWGTFERKLNFSFQKKLVEGALASNIKTPSALYNQPVSECDSAGFRAYHFYWGRQGLANYSVVQRTNEVGTLSQEVLSPEERSSSFYEVTRLRARSDRADNLKYFWRVKMGFDSPLYHIETPYSDWQTLAAGC